MRHYVKACETLGWLKLVLKLHAWAELKTNHCKTLQIDFFIHWYPSIFHVIVFNRIMKHESHMIFSKNYIIWKFSRNSFSLCSLSNMPLSQFGIYKDWYYQKMKRLMSMGTKEPTWYNAKLTCKSANRLIKTVLIAWIWIIKIMIFLVHCWKYTPNCCIQLMD